MKSVRSTPLVYAAWILIAILFATVAKFTTGISWKISILLAVVTGGVGCFISIWMCYWSDRQNIRRINLIIFCGVGLVLTLVIPSARGGSFDPTGIRMLLFTAAGLVMTAFFLPEASHIPHGDQQ